jgi:hypothetical protein
MFCRGSCNKKGAQISAWAFSHVKEKTKENWLFLFMMEELQDEDGYTLTFYGEKITNCALCYKICDKMHPPS